MSCAENIGVILLTNEAGRILNSSQAGLEPAAHKSINDLSVWFEKIAVCFHMLHRAGFEPAPPKRVGLESTALDRSANDALSLSFSFL